MNFGLPVDTDLPKTNTKPEVVLSLRGRHYEIVYDIITPSWVD